MCKIKSLKLKSFNKMHLNDFKATKLSEYQLNFVIYVNV